jgi:Ca2+-binding RTX toxin-like protein
MSLRFKTSTDAAYTTIIGDMDAVTPKYTYETDLLPDLIKFTLESTTAWGSNKNVLLDVDDAAKREVIVKNFVNAELDLSMSDQATVTVDGAKRGEIMTGLGDDAVNVAVLNSNNAGHVGWDDPSVLENAIFDIDTGAGNDTVTFSLGTATPGLNKAVSEFTKANIDTGDGDDTIDMRGGGTLNTVDEIDAGAGNDTVHSGGGNDIVYGGAGDDLIHASRGSDTLFGGDGDDEMYGESGTDILEGGAGADLLDGGSGADTVYGGDGDDFVLGRAGNDTVYGGDGDDKVTGSSGSDLLFGDAGADRFLIGVSDLIADDLSPVVDTIADFNGAEGDRIDVVTPSAWVFSDDGLNGKLTNASLPTGAEVHLTGVTAAEFDSAWLI